VGRHNVMSASSGFSPEAPRAAPSTRTSAASHRTVIYSNVFAYNCYRYEDKGGHTEEVDPALLLAGHDR
jgi:hypothetical protein